MSLSSCGAYVNGARPKTKKALKEACAADPSKVTIENHSMFTGPGDFTYGPATELPEGVAAIVAGPDPERKRNWFAQVKRTGDTVKVS